MISSILKTAGACNVQRLRSIAIQQMKKWFVTLVLLQTEQLLMQIAPPLSIGCFKGDRGSTIAGVTPFLLLHSFAF